MIGVGSSSPTRSGAFRLEKEDPSDLGRIGLPDGTARKWVERDYSGVFFLVLGSCLSFAYDYWISIYQSR